ncbi:TIGR02281 family clan AA aspartic protease [Halovulum dunhuangense]|uniref:TIGR02281 family clan AA aspartic protease n=1 Tax=Halovulum dunhuangense TaxID=1505036 RepID=A0A849L3M2_9RHOB|nr:TIGR02281 family clan AA aspartic protease [Halovulum dunhuangense]NNU80802.1 TIGR02281 family clan AA aspartic protease [Halovulum dunhuangense]
MSENDVARLIYLGLLLLFVGGMLFVGGRAGIGAKLRHMLTWVGIFLMLILAYGQRDVILSQLSPTPPRAERLAGGSIALPRSPGGSFEATLQVNGVPVRFLVDTGATEVVLSLEDARRAGFDPDRLEFRGRAITANGTVQTAPIRIEEITFAGLTDRNIRASVNGGELGVSLLGMNYLNRFERIEITSDRMLLVRP